MTEPKDSPYILGHHSDELQRLIHQSRYLGELTEDILHKAGLEPGMSVLDVGCGAGDVSFLAAKLVGRAGSVIGIDRSSEAVALARQRAEDVGFQNLKFEQADLEQFSPNLQVDALIGRLVLLYMRDPAGSLRGWSKAVRRGGIVAFHEMVMSGMRSVPPAPTYDKAGGHVIEAFRRAGNEVDMGLHLYETFTAAGLPAPEMLMGGRVEGEPDAQGYLAIAGIVRTLLPAMERFGLWSAAEADVDTLAARMRDEVVAGGGVIVAPPLVGAWTRMPM